ncbi:hypothetical protein MTO96_024474 [Rhipicephalus appendiculatus]
MEKQEIYAWYYIERAEATPAFLTEVAYSVQRRERVGEGVPRLDWRDERTARWASSAARRGFPGALASAGARARPSPSGGRLALTTAERGRPDSFAWGAPAAGWLLKNGALVVVVAAVIPNSHGDAATAGASAEGDMRKGGRQATLRAVPSATTTEPAKRPLQRQSCLGWRSFLRRGHLEGPPPLR